MNQYQHRCRFYLVTAAVLAGFVCTQGQAAAPSTLWTNSLGAQLFAIDSQTNVYANAGTNVYKLNSSGALIEAVTLGTRPGLVRRDGQGNFYLAGTVPGFPKSDGLTLTNLACYVMKFSPSGTMLWSNGFGPTGFLRNVAVTDLQTDSNGLTHVGFAFNSSTSTHSTQVARYDSDGTNLWTSGLPLRGFPWNSASGTARATAMPAGNGYGIDYSSLSGDSGARLSRFDNDGTVTSIATFNVYGFSSVPMARPVVDSSAEVYYIEVPFGGSSSLYKADTNGNIFWTALLPSGNWRGAVGPDQWNGVHITSLDKQLARYDSDGNAVWTLDFPAVPTDLMLDDQGNRFVSLANGAIVRLGTEPLFGPVITNAPQSVTVLAGSNVTFTVGATGSTPLRYSWLFQNAILAGATNSTLSLLSVTTNQAGSYSAVVTNVANVVTSTPALLRVKRVEVFSGNQPLSAGSYTFYTTPTFAIRSAFPGGSIFYTLNGATPNFLSTPYSTSFSLSSNAIIRAIGYSADFSQSEEADVVNVTIVPPHTLTVSTAGGGTVNLNPPGGTYAATNVVQVTATPTAGWSFLGWTGDASGSVSPINVLMDQNRTIQAVFGTTLSTTVAGNGTVQVYPAYSLHAYGSVVRLTAVPQPGSFFGAWGNAASGSVNPLYFTITSATQTVSSIFGTLSEGQATLTTLITGPGQVSANPQANVYATNESVILTATPFKGQGFVSWSGDAGGSVNPLTVDMTQSRVVMATFTNWPVLVAKGRTPQGFVFSMYSGLSSPYQVFSSTNLRTWQSMALVSNLTGGIQFTDTAPATLPAKFYKAVAP